MDFVLLLDGKYYNTYNIPEDKLSVYLSIDGERIEFFKMKVMIGLKGFYIFVAFTKSAAEKKDQFEIKST